MLHYAALDVSNEETAIHILDETGTTVWRGKRASDPEVLATALRRHAPELVRVGLETLWADGRQRGRPRVREQGARAYH